MTTGNRSGSVLVVDHDITKGLELVSQLAKLGIKADLAVNAVDALRQYQAQEYNLILISVHSAEITGYKASAAIRKFETESQLYPVAVVALGSELDVHLCKSSGIIECVKKPITIEVLREIIATWIK